MKATSLRLDDALAAKLSAVAKTEGVSASKIVREAISELVDERLADPKFKARVMERLEQELAAIKEAG